ncbi:anaerobic sulfatase maturase [bacterium]|nr:anaerobic sulfatase maturase [bacterium]
MKKATRTFQVFAKPASYRCNLRCEYCYYLDKKNYFINSQSLQMSDDILECYIRQHINASIDPVITFSWHGGEPTILGIDFFRKIVALQKKYQPLKQRIANAIQTNGTLLTDDWCRFLADEGIIVGLSLDGPEEMHNRFRSAAGQQPTFDKALNSYYRLKQHKVYCDILCTVNSHNVKYPLQLYRFFKEIEAPYITFLPVVYRSECKNTEVSTATVPAEAWGDFLITIFDEWKQRDIEIININIFEETSRLAFGQEQALCIFRKTCGDIPVVEYNGDTFSCDHFVRDEHKIGNIRNISLAEMIEGRQQRAFGKAKADLPDYCLTCEVLSMCNGGCPKDRFLATPDGKTGLNYLCTGYKRFFKHFQPFVAELKNLWQQQNKARSNQMTDATDRNRTGRNDPCPCGSGKKYKRCCLIKS